MSVTHESNLTKFIWRIENFSSIKDDSLQSPSFKSHSVLWSVTIYPSDKKYIHVILKQLDLQPVTVNCSIAFLDSNGLPLIFREREKESSIRYSRNYQTIEKILINLRYVTWDDLFGSRKFKFLFNDTLTLECRIWEKSDNFLKSLTCLAQTRFESYPLKPVKKTFVLKVNDVSSLLPDYALEHVEENTRDGDSLKIRITFSGEKEFLAYVKVPLLTIHANFKVSMLDVSGKRYEFADVEFDFVDKFGEKSFRTNINKFMLMTYRNEFLPNDSLSLEFKCTLFFKISFSRLVENDGNFVDHADLPLQTTIKHEIKANQPSDVFQTLQTIYEEEFLPDFSLKVSDKEFPVHKAILGARSSVFRAMFTADMKEKDSGSVDIPDVDADTIQRMLKFIYCDSVQEDMQWESTSNLYAAADKYALEPLKQRCSNILKTELCPSSVLGTLLLADTHQDEDMRDAALDFILGHDKEIIGAELWNKFAEEHSKLAFDTIQRVYLKKING